MKEIPQDATIGDRYSPAMEITDPQEAAEYFEALVRRLTEKGYTREAAEKLERENLGYFSGYCDLETMQRVGKLFGGVHPVFGSFA